MKTIFKNKQIKCLQTYQGSPDNNKKKKKFSFYGSRSFSSSFVARNTPKYSNKTKKTKE